MYVQIFSQYQPTYFQLLSKNHQKLTFGQFFHEIWAKSKVELYFPSNIQEKIEQRKSTLILRNSYIETRQIGPQY